jgi:hypothetical protein
LPLEHLKIREYHALRKILLYEVKWGCAIMVLTTVGAPKNPRKTSFPGNPAPGWNPGLKRTRKEAIFKKSYMKTIIKLKMNVFRNILNLLFAQQYYLQASPISWDYPFSRDSLMKHIDIFNILLYSWDLSIHPLGNFRFTNFHFL